LSVRAATVVYECCFVSVRRNALPDHRGNARLSAARIERELPEVILLEQEAHIVA
jgi:hypothetical protein